MSFGGRRGPNWGRQQPMFDGPQMMGPGGPGPGPFFDGPPAFGGPPQGGPFFDGPQGPGPFFDGPGPMGPPAFCPGPQGPGPFFDDSGPMGPPAFCTGPQGPGPFFDGPGGPGPMGPPFGRGPMRFDGPPMESDGFGAYPASEDYRPQKRVGLMDDLASGIDDDREMDTGAIDVDLSRKSMQAANRRGLLDDSSTNR